MKAGIAGSDEHVFLVFIFLNKSLFPLCSFPHPRPAPPLPRRPEGSAQQGELAQQAAQNLRRPGVRLGPGLQLPLVVLGNEPLDVGQLAVQVLAAVLFLAVVGVGLQERGRPEPHPPPASVPECSRAKCCLVCQPTGSPGLPPPLPAGQRPPRKDEDPCSTSGQSPGLVPLPKPHPGKQSH